MITSRHLNLLGAARSPQLHERPCLSLTIMARQLILLGTAQMSAVRKTPCLYGLRLRGRLRMRSVRRTGGERLTGERLSRARDLCC